MTIAATATATASAWQRIDDRVEELIAARLGAGARDLALADALRVIAASSRSGATIQQALLRASQRAGDPVAHACGQAAARIAIGHPVERSVDQLASRIDTPAARLFATIVRVQHRRGGDLGGPCHRLASMLHERVRLDGEARSATAQARFSARAVLVIPVLLAVAAWWRAPDAVGELVRPDAILLASPGLLLIAIGAVVVRRIAQEAVRMGRGQATARAAEPGPSRRVLTLVAGSGAYSMRSIRMSGAALLMCTPALLMRPTPLMLGCSTLAVACAAAWPWSDRTRARRTQSTIARSGVESLLEVSIALLAAGATAHEVATIAPASCEEPLRSALAPAVHLVGLGRTVASAYGDLPVVVASPQLDGWLHAICATAELGAPSITVLEQLLRDARASRREQLRQVAQTAAPRMQLALVLLVVPGIMWLMLLATVGGLVRQLGASGVM